MMRSKMLFKLNCQCFVYHQQNYSTKGGSSGKIMKDLNYVNKALFGAVENKKNLTRKNESETQPICMNENNEFTSQKGIGSEMYWLLNHESSAKVRKVRSKKLKEKLLEKSEPTPLISTLQTTPKPPISLESSNNNLLLNVTPIKLMDLLKSFPAYYESSITTGTSLIPNSDDVEGHERKWNNKQLPSVSKILQATMPMAARKALQQWKLSKIAELGENGFIELQKSHLMIGSNFHNAIQHFFHTQQEPIADSDDVTSPAVLQLWSSLRKTLTEIDSKPVLIEARILHPLLQYRGIVDCVAKFGHELAVIEWKKSDRAKETLSATFDAPLQLCAYLGAINADPIYQSNIGQIKSGLVIVAYTNGSQAHCYRLNEKDVRKYWSQWLKRLHEYWVRTADGTLPEPI